MKKQNKKELIKNIFTTIAIGGVFLFWIASVIGAVILMVTFIR